MDSKVNASYEAIAQLVNEINEGLKKIDLLNNMLEDNLKHLERSFEDDGIAIVQSYVNKAQNKVQESIPDFVVVMEKLSQYAEALYKSQKAL